MHQAQSEKKNKRWIAEIEVEAEGLLPPGTPELTYSDPREPFLVRLKNRKVSPLADKPLLEMQLEFEAPDLEAADKAATQLARQFLYWLSFVSHAGYRMRRVERVIDWTPGLTMRDQFIHHIDTTTMPHPVLTPDLIDTLRLLNQEETPAAVERAIRWFAMGVRAELQDDQFQCFFFALEVLAEHEKNSAKVPDRCPRCKNALFCSSCNETPTHRPYIKQAIEELVTKTVVPEWAETFTLLNMVRNRIMHGDHVEEIETELGVEFADIVDRAGFVAWTAIVNAIPKPPPGDHLLAFGRTSTFVRRILTYKVHAQMGSKSGDPSSPRLEDMATLQISTVLQPRKKKKPSTQEPPPSSRNP